MASFFKRKSSDRSSLAPPGTTGRTVFCRNEPPATSFRRTLGSLLLLSTSAFHFRPVDCIRLLTIYSIGVKLCSAIAFCLLTLAMRYSAVIRKLSDVNITGYGMVITERFGQPEWYHGGGIKGFATAIQLYPKARVCVVVLSNVDSIKSAGTSQLNLRVWS